MPIFECLCYVPTFDHGVPNHWLTAEELEYQRGTDFRGVAIDPDDPPAYESEAAYLHRHGLLSAAELAAVKRLDLLREVTVVEPAQQDEVH